MRGCGRSLSLNLGVEPASCLMITKFWDGNRSKSTIFVKTRGWVIHLTQYTFIVGDFELIVGLFSLSEDHDPISVHDVFEASF